MEAIKQLYPFFSLNNTSYVDAAYGVICLVVFCSLLLAPPKRRVLKADSMAQTAKALPSRFLAINPLLASSPKGYASNMQIAHAGIVFFITGVLFSNTQKQQFTTVLRYGSESVLGTNQICCLRGIDNNYGPTFHAICGNLVVYQQLTTSAQSKWCSLRAVVGGFLKSYGPQSASQQVARCDSRSATLAQHGVCVVRQTPWSEDRQISYSFCAPHTLVTTTGVQSWASAASVCAAESLAVRQQKAKPPASQWPRQLCLFPEKRFGLTNQFSTTKVAIHTNLLTDFYGVLGAGSAENGWSTSIMKLPFMFCLWIGFLFAALGAVFSISNQLHRTPLKWY